MVQPKLHEKSSCLYKGAGGGLTVLAMSYEQVCSFGGLEAETLIQVTLGLWKVYLFALHLPQHGLGELSLHTMLGK